MNSGGEASAARHAEPFALPIFLTRRNKWPSAFLMFGFAAAVYLLSNHFPLTTPRLLPMTWVDEKIPLLPWTVWIYTSEWLLFASAYAFFKDMFNANKFIYSFFALQVISVIIFWVWPTTYPRADYPLPLDLDAATYYVFSGLRGVDTPGNCCPSLHVSSVFLASFIYLDEQREKFLIFFFWAMAVAASTLTTKQHYVIDVFTGFLMAVVIYWIFHRFVRYRDVAPVQAKR